MTNKQKKSNNTKNKLLNLTLCLGIISVGIMTNSDIYAVPKYPRYGLFQPYTRPRYPSRNEKKNDFESVLRKNSKFSNFLDGLEQANLLDTLKKSCTKDEPSCLTIFVPNDEAFNNASNSDFKKYNQPENRVRFLKYHLIKGPISTQDIDNGSIVTMEGNSIKISERSEGVYKLNTANAKHPSIITKNAVIIEIDKLLLPPDL